MKEYVLLLFIVVHIATCEKATDKLKRKLIVPKISTECRKIKCSSVEAPECVKLTRLDWNTTFHIIVINKCELDYIKCHDDVEAKIVPMKYCGHTNDKKHVNKHKKPAGIKRVKRYLRRLKESSSSESNELPGNRSDPNKFASHKRRKQLRSSSLAVIAGHSVDAFDFDEDMSNPTSSEKIIKKIDKYNQDPNKMYAKSVNTDFASFPMVSEESRYDNQTMVLKGAEKDFYDSCPSVCPSKDVMVCAKCQHGIYKTFVSVCHMRIFTCHHSDEVLQLIARYPCVMSAPYASEPEMKPVGRVMEDTDDDMVLNYIMHRDNGLIGNSEESIPDIGSRIIGGENIDISDAPYQVAIDERDAGLCGGSIIDSYAVLTAAFCTQARHLDGYEIRVGSTFNYKGGEIFRPSHISRHPNYTLHSKDYDIAIIFVKRKFKLSNILELMDPKEEISDDEYFVITGWGTDEDGTYEGPRECLQRVVAPKINWTYCKERYALILGIKITPRMICAGRKTKNFCNSDVGGPLVYKNKLAGVLAFRECGMRSLFAPMPGVSMKVSAFRPWIDNELKKYSPSKIKW